MKLSALKLSWEDTYREMAASDEDWADWDVTVNDGLDADRCKRSLVTLFSEIDDFAIFCHLNL